MQIRRAKMEEGDFLSEIALRSKAYWGYDDSFIEACRQALTISKECIASNYVYVLEDKSVIMDFFCLVANGKAGELDSLFIDTQFIGKGYGRLLWNSILQNAKDIGIDEFTIDADPNAEEFYKKMGAIRIGEVESTVFENRKLPLMKVLVT